VLGVPGAPPVVQLLSAGTAPLTATVQGVTRTTSVRAVAETFYALVPAERRLNRAGRGREKRRGSSAGSTASRGTRS
jgi:hypothetical protein